MNHTTAIGMMPFEFGAGINFGVNFLQVFFTFSLLCLIVVGIYKLMKDFFETRRSEASSVASHKKQAYRFAKAMKKCGKVVTSSDLAELEEDLKEFPQTQHKELYSRWESRMNQKFIFESSSFGSSNEDTTGNPHNMGIASNEDRTSTINFITASMEKGKIPFNDGIKLICQVEEAKYNSEIGSILLGAKLIG